jgi:hypothetical protein
MGSPPVCFLEVTAIFLLRAGSGKRHGGVPLLIASRTSVMVGIAWEKRRQTDTELQHFATISGE